VVCVSVGVAGVVGRRGVWGGGRVDVVRGMSDGVALG
jgi:hypothetical protein